MTTLQQVLQLSAFPALSDADALTLLLSTVNGAPDQQIWHWDGVLAVLGTGATANGLTLQQAATARDILATMPTGYLTLDALLTTGVLLSSPQFQATVQAMEIAEPPNAVLVLNAILAIGATPQLPYWQQAGLSIAPVLANVTAARVLIAAQGDMARMVAAWTVVSNQAAEDMAAGVPMTWTQSVTLYSQQ